MPVYNVEKYIGKSIQSVLAQTHKNFELLVINDGTKDNSMAVVSGIKDERVKVFQKANGGLSDARNFGLSKATGDYIYFIDSDDWAEATLLEDCVSVMEKEDLDVVVFGYVQDNEDRERNVTHSRNYIPAERTFVKGQGNLEIDEFQLKLLGYAWNKMYRKSFLDKHNLIFEKGTSVVEDILFNSNVFAKADKLRFIGKALYHYCNRPVETLIKAYHENSFELKVRKTKSLKLFLDAWNTNEKHKNEILSLSLILGIRYCIHSLFAFRNNLSASMKTVRIKEMVTHPMTRQLIDYYQVKSPKDWLFKKMIKSGNAKAITIFANTVK